MPVTKEDTRKVRTAVSGHSGSDLPAYLPMDADDFGAFMRRHPERAFFCGRLPRPRHRSLTGAWHCVGTPSAGDASGHTAS